MKAQILERGNLLNRVAVAQEQYSWCRHRRDNHDICLWDADLNVQNSTVSRQGINERLQLLRRGRYHQRKALFSASCADSVSQQQEPQSPGSDASYQ